MSEAQTKGRGTPADPWQLTTPPGTSAFEAWRDEADPPALALGRVHLVAAARQHECAADLPHLLWTHPPDEGP
jgi:hypothetical protein